MATKKEGATEDKSRPMSTCEFCLAAGVPREKAQFDNSGLNTHIRFNHREEWSNWKQRSTAEERQAQAADRLGGEFLRGYAQGYQSGVRDERLGLANALT